MADINELDQIAHQVSVSWDKAHNYYVSMTKIAFEAKRKLDAGEYPGWTFAMWLGQKVHVTEPTFLGIVNAHKKALADSEQEELNKEIQRKEAEKRQERLKVEAEKKAIREAKEAEKQALLADQQIQEQLKAGQEAIAILEHKKILKRASDQRSRDKKKTDKATVSIEQIPANLDNVLLNELKTEIHSAIAQENQSQNDFADSVIRQAKALAKVKEQFGGETRFFGKWLNDNGIKYTDNKRTALIGLSGIEENELRIFIMNGDTRSIRFIWRDFCNAARAPRSA